jgi:hypothetical protein
MPLFEIPQDIIDEWLTWAVPETVQELNENWAAGFGGREIEAYEWGTEDGRALAARAILRELGIEIP